MEATLQKTRLQLASLVIFRRILKDPVIAAFCELLDSGDAPMHRRAELYGAFVHKLMAVGGNFSEHLLNRLLCDENPYVLSLGEGKTPAPLLSELLAAELAALESAGQTSWGAVAADIGCPIPLPRWETSALDYAARYHAYTARISALGYGIYAEHAMFLLSGDALVPVQNPDPADLDCLTGYEREREAVVLNTLALLEGKPAANVLLYGDSGTGKSTCVKAVANRFRHRGLRLIEVRRDQLRQIPAVIGRLSKNPLKFILFIDDLSFARDSDNLSALKAILEGSVSAKTGNIAIYATSNRRHLVRERFSDRDGDDVHARDTLEELSSLSDRFGLTVTFLRPDRDLYLSIAKQYLEQYGVSLNGEDLLKQAEAFALRRGGRSARAARQFAESLAAQGNLFNNEGETR